MRIALDAPQSEWIGNARVTAYLFETMTTDLRVVATYWYRATARTFHASANFMDVLKQFGELDADVRIVRVVLLLLCAVGSPVAAGGLLPDPRQVEVRQVQGAGHCAGHQGRPHADGWPSRWRTCALPLLCLHRQPTLTTLRTTDV